MNILYWLVIITPIIPKIKLVEGVFVYPFELALILYGFILLYRQKIPVILYHLKASRYLLYFWLLLGFFTIINFPFYPNLPDALRNIKGLIYLPIIFIGYKFHNHLLKHMLIAGILSATVNILYYFLVSYPEYGFEIWNPLALFSGMSNKYFDLASMSIYLIEKGAHGIYGDYLVLLMAIVLCLTSTRKIHLISALSLILFFWISHSANGQ